MTVNTITMEIS